MNTTPLTPSHSRRNFIKISAGAAASLAASSQLYAQGQRKLRTVFIGVGNRGVANISSVMSHKKAEAVAFCDVNKGYLKRWKKKFPNALFLADYRQLFSDHADKFDAVVVSTPDHMHAPIILQALSHDKHVYGEKPLLHQLDELRMLRNALAAKPKLVTQMGNQRSCSPFKMQFVELLRSGAFGKIKDSWVWSQPMRANRYFLPPNLDEYPESKGNAPKNASWDLWLGCSKQELDFIPDVFVRKWRACWEFGNGVMGDWTPHLVDAVVYGMDLKSGPEKAVTETKSKRHRVTFGDHFHSKLTFGGVKASGDKKFTINVTDGKKPKPEDYHFPKNLKLGVNQTMIDTDAGTIISSADGRGWDIYKDGKSVKKSFTMPKTTPHHHWHDWVENCLGGNKHLWSPFETGCLITELALLPAKLTAFPNQEIGWDSEKCRFVDHEQANASIVSRNYRKGFTIPGEFA